MICFRAKTDLRAPEKEITIRRKNMSLGPYEKR